MLNKQHWKELCRKTKFASKKRRLSKKELGEVMQAQIALNSLGVFDKPQFSEQARVDPIHALMQQAMKVGNLTSSNLE
jgi:hypothetical protein